MPSDLAEAYNEVAGIGTAPGTARSCWQSLLAYLSSNANVSSLSAVAIEDDVHLVRRQVAALFETQPPVTPLMALYFGLYDAIDNDGRQLVGFHVYGIEHYDPTNDDTLCRPSWQPKGRYLNSIALNELKRAEFSASGEAREFLGYAGQLGVALIVSRFAAETPVPHAVRVVGFDSGDRVEFSVQFVGAA